MSETFIKINLLQHLEIQDKPILRTGQNSALTEVINTNTKHTTPLL